MPSLLSLVQRFRCIVKAMVIINFMVMRQCAIFAAIWEWRKDLPEEKARFPGRGAI